ncbi:MAG: L-histidine N(alpha)-methyltransferase, partial [Sphingomonadales bacterium]|nr:L-histidine N(alpha)-methyltransferase [Sphingomonadales bacterium]
EPTLATSEKTSGTASSILDDDSLDNDILGDDFLGDDFIGDSSDLGGAENNIEALASDPDSQKRKANFIDLKPTIESFRESVLAGLKSGPKILYAKHFYDEKGSELFNQICKLEEYYPTETEKGILRRRIRTIAQQLAEKVQLVEFGSGSSDKVRILLRALEHFDSYVPIDISREILMQSADQLATEFPHIDVTAICADYTKRVDLPPPSLERSGGRLGFFPGSTIGNFAPDDAKSFLERAGDILGSGAGLIVGVDMKKDKEILEKAYNDEAGVTAKFNLNILTRINSELDGNFKLGNFEHLAFYNEDESRIEMHLVSLKNQKVIVAGEEIVFEEGETIHTESSYKYSIQDFQQLVVDTGLKHAAVWEDPNHLFSVHYIKIP